MDRKAIARKIIDAIFDDAEAEGRVLHRDRVTDIAEKILLAEIPNDGEGLRPARGASAPVDAVYPWAPITQTAVTRFCRMPSAVDCQDEPVIWGME